MITILKKDLLGYAYLSHETDFWQPKFLRTLVDEAMFANSQHNITGFLYYKAPYFVQYIEGKEDDLSQLVDLLNSDNRHKIEYDCYFNKFGKRLFPRWSMWLQTDSKAMRASMEVILKHHNRAAQDKENILSSMQSLARKVEQHTQLGLSF